MLKTSEKIDAPGAGRIMDTEIAARPRRHPVGMNRLAGQTPAPTPELPEHFGT